MDAQNCELVRVPNTHKSGNHHNIRAIRCSNLAVLVAKSVELVGSPQGLYGCLQKLAELQAAVRSLTEMAVRVQCGNRNRNLKNDREVKLLGGRELKHYPWEDLQK